MSTYLGYIEKKDPYFGGGSFFNYKPIYHLAEGNLTELTASDKESLLPDSRQRDINFAYDYKNYEQCEAMERKFFHKKLVIFEFVTEDLQDNYNNRGERNPTGYKVNVLELLRLNKIRDIHAEGIYNLIEYRSIKSDFYNDNIILIEGDVLSSNMKVLLEIDNSIYAGPYTVDYRELDQAYYVRPQIKENKHIIGGYLQEHGEKMELSPFDYSWSYNDKTWPIVKLNEDAQLQKLDVITDDNLLKSFRDNLSARHIENGHINLTDIDAVLENYEKSIFSGTSINEEIRSSRLEKLYGLLKAESDVDHTFSKITDFVSDLIIQYRHTPKIDELVRIITEKDPDLLENLKEVRFIKEHMAKVVQEKEMLEADFESAKQEAFIISNFEAIAEAKAKEQLALDEKYNSKKAQLQEISQTLDIGSDVASLHNRLSHLQKEEEYFLSKQAQLADAIRKSEEKFFEMFKNAQKRLGEVSYNGLLANHIMHAAAGWEQEESARAYMRSVNSITELKPVEFETGELIDYLYDTIKIARPQYSKNEIINIAICISQGFLTVFSGAPGCGKTSICNIIGEVLGLNKIGELNRSHEQIRTQSEVSLKRYISVSVERGWTSKRDFVGYYNPLTKTFDKSNRQVYDALKILHMENSGGVNKHPFLVLLDEANLSPMEYYWADFMNVCDDLTPNSHINLGEDNIFTIPETLHFVATINNDHTTETLSPRLIDRAWVVTLPHFKTPMMGELIPPEKIKHVSWQSMKRAFVPDARNIQMPTAIQRLYERILGLLKGYLHISPRTYFTISRYCVAASALFTEDAQYKTSPGIVALDYAIAQKILPKINGSGEGFLAWLGDFHKFCNDNDLFFSASILKKIMDNGKTNMSYYHFFGE